MDYEKLRSCSREEREELLLSTLDEGRKRVVAAFNLRCNSELKWYRYEDELPDQPLFSHKYLLKSSVLKSIFRVHGLCSAKSSYFEREWESFTPYIYDWNRGFCPSDIYEMGFLKHEVSGLYFDFRELRKIRVYEKFIELTEYLKNF